MDVEDEQDEVEGMEMVPGTETELTEEEEGTEEEDTDTVEEDTGPVPVPVPGVGEVERGEEGDLIGVETDMMDINEKDPKITTFYPLWLGQKTIIDPSSNCVPSTPQSSYRDVFVEAHKQLAFLGASASVFCVSDYFCSDCCCCCFGKWPS